jgi:hypothetical protein
MEVVGLSMNLKPEMKINSPEYEGRQGGGSVCGEGKPVIQQPFLYCLE